MRVKCLAQEDNTMSPARARTRTACSGVERTYHEATLPPTQVNKMKPFCLLGITWCVLQEMFPQKPYSKFFVSQACSVKKAGNWPQPFFLQVYVPPLCHGS